MASKKEKNQTFIHIKATSQVLSINAIVPENKACSVLEDLRNNFMRMKDKFNLFDDKLIVKTCVHNPTIFQ
jgi:hypothetical protein